MMSAGSSRDLDRLLQKLFADRGFDAARYRRSYIERRIATRLRAVQLDTYREYRTLLDRDAEEYNRLIGALTVNVTEFFRDKPVWDLFDREVVPELLASKARRRQRLLRVWSAGCSAGEEPYSIAMLLNHAAERAGVNLTVSVHATDIDAESLDKARAGEYPNKELESVPLRFRHECEPADDGHFRISQRIRQLVKFRRLDLFADKPIAAVDVIFCRNVLIYFDRGQQEQIFAKFYAALNRNCYIVIGKSEKIGGDVAQHFEPVSSREKVYKRRD